MIVVHLASVDGSRLVGTLRSVEVKESLSRLIMNARSIEMQVKGRMEWLT
jgi:hypothetical protein